MSATVPTGTASASTPAAPTAPTNPPMISSMLTPEIISSVEEILVMGLSFAFPAAGPLIAVSDAAIKKIVPYILAAINGKQFTLAELKAMQADLNSFGGSFPNAPGYNNPFVPGPGGAGAGAPVGAGVPLSATINLGPGQQVVLTADSVTNLLKMFGIFRPEALPV